jgi:hypothetical protein
MNLDFLTGKAWKPKPNFRGLYFVSYPMQKRFSIPISDFTGQRWWTSKASYRINTTYYVNTDFPILQKYTRGRK